MASSTSLGLSCTSSPATPAACMRPSSASAAASASRSVAFALDCRRPALNGLRASSGRRGVVLERTFKRLAIRAEAAAEAGEAELASPPSPPPTPAPRKKSKVSVKSGRKQRVVLRFLWLEKNIGISLDQVVPGHGIIPLSPYFFWPRKDAWEELKAKLDSKKWISRKTTIILLNQATDIINLWQQNATNLL